MFNVSSQYVDDQATFSQVTAQILCISNQHTESFQMEVDVESRRFSLRFANNINFRNDDSFLQKIM